MSQNENNPSGLNEDALRRLYLGAPGKLEQARRAAASALYSAYFGADGSNGSSPQPAAIWGPSSRVQRAVHDALGLPRSSGSGPPEGADQSYARLQIQAPDGAGGIRLATPSSLGIRLEGGESRANPRFTPRLSRGEFRAIPQARAYPNGLVPAAGKRLTVASQARPTPNRPARLATRPYIGPLPSEPKPRRHDVWINGRQPGEIDPSKTDVFRTGPDGKLHPIPGWRTTGPTDFKKWSPRFDWDGVGEDLTDITTSALDFMSGAGLADEVFKGLGFKFGPDVVRGIIEGHHAWPKFLGGPSKQELAELYKSIHTMYHVDLGKALREAGFPRVGGKGGAINNWADLFRAAPAKQREALEILRRVTKKFDNRNNTQLSRYLESELEKGKLSIPD
jgi:hypothetical protein